MELEQAYVDPTEAKCQAAGYSDEDVFLDMGSAATRHLGRKHGLYGSSLQHQVRGLGVGWERAGGRLPDAPSGKAAIPVRLRLGLVRVALQKGPSLWKARCHYY